MAAKKVAEPPQRIHLRCKVTGCDFHADPEDANLQQYADLTFHFQTHFPGGSAMDEKKNLGSGHDGLPGHPTPTSPSVLDAIWAEMDAYTAKAIEWPAAPDSGDPWVDNTQLRIAKLENDLAKVQATAVGRGLAIAIQKMQYARYDSPADVIQEAVRRYREKASSDS